MWKTKNGPDGPAFSSGTMAALGAPLAAFSGDDRNGGPPRSVDLKLVMDFAVVVKSFSGVVYHLTTYCHFPATVAAECDGSQLGLWSAMGGNYWRQMFVLRWLQLIR